MSMKRIKGISSIIFLSICLGSVLIDKSVYAEIVTDFETVNEQRVVNTSADGSRKTLEDGSEIVRDGSKWYGDQGEVTITYNEIVEKDPPIPNEPIEPILQQVETFPTVYIQTTEAVAPAFELTVAQPQPDLQTPEVFPPTVIEEVPITELPQQPISTKDLLKTTTTDSTLNDPQPVLPIVEVPSKEEQSAVSKKLPTNLQKLQEIETSAPAIDDQEINVEPATVTDAASNKTNTEAKAPAIALVTFPKTNEQRSVVLGISGVVLFAVGILGVFFKWRGTRADS